MRITELENFLKKKNNNDTGRHNVVPRPCKRDRVMYRKLKVNYTKFQWRTLLGENIFHTALIANCSSSNKSVCREFK